MYWHLNANVVYIQLLGSANNNELAHCRPLSPHYTETSLKLIQ